MVKYRYKMNQVVSHVLTGEKGIVLARRLYEDSTSRMVEYYLSIGLGNAAWCSEEVLNEVKEEV